MAERVTFLHQIVTEHVLAIKLTYGEQYKLHSLDARPSSSVFRVSNTKSRWRGEQRLYYTMLTLPASYRTATATATGQSQQNSTASEGLTEAFTP